MKLLNIINKLIINVMVICVGLWCFYVIIMAIRGTFNLV